MRGGGGKKPLFSLLPLVVLEPAQKRDKRVGKQKYTHVYHKEKDGGVKPCRIRDCMVARSCCSHSQ